MENCFSFSEISSFSDETKLSVLFEIRVHQKFLTFSLNQTRAINDNKQIFDGSFHTKSHFEWLRSTGQL